MKKMNNGYFGTAKFTSYALKTGRLFLRSYKKDSCKEVP